MSDRFRFMMITIISTNCPLYTRKHLQLFHQCFAVATVCVNWSTCVTVIDRSHCTRFWEASSGHDFSMQRCTIEYSFTKCRSHHADENGWDKMLKKHQKLTNFGCFYKFLSQPCRRRLNRFCSGFSIQFNVYMCRTWSQTVQPKLRKSLTSTSVPLIWL